MRTLLLLGLLLLNATNTWSRPLLWHETLRNFLSQKNLFFVAPANDNCTNATILQVNTNNTCTLTTNGTFLDSSIENTIGGNGCDQWQWSPQKDVWYEFTATSNTHIINISAPQELWSIYVEVYPNNVCTNDSNPLVCGNIQVQSTNFVVGTSYKVRVYSTSDTSNTDFTICVRQMSPPANDDCNSATLLQVNTDATCTINTAGTLTDSFLTTGMTQSCFPWQNAVNDVWYEFTATSTSHAVSLLNLNNPWSTYIQVFASSVCNTPTTPALACNNESVVLSNLTIGELYKIRVFSTSNTTTSDFNICVRTLSSPENDDCTDAITLPVNPGTECVSTVEGTLEDATISTDGGVGCSFDQAVKDVWYQFTATHVRHAISLNIPQNDFTTFLEVFPDNVCGNPAIASIDCVDQSDIILNNLVPGTTYKVRVFTASPSTQTDYTICVTTLNNSIEVSDEYTYEELVNDVLIRSNCIAVTNINAITGTNFGDVNGIGYFNKGESNFPFEEGVILSTGNIHIAPGPLNNVLTSSGGYNWVGDTQLTNYMNNFLGQNSTYNNASILEFDFEALSDKLEFNFIFASNEYGPFQCSYSDSFAFFLTNTATNQTTNLAIVPNTNNPISVVTIRKGEYSPQGANGPQCGDANPEYFGNYYTATGDIGLPGISAPINFRGHTVPMTASADIEPGTTYRIKLVIQDRGDVSFDSAVFIEGGSFNFGSVDLGGNRLISDGNALCYGEEITLSTGLDPADYTFEWFKDNMEIVGATGADLTVSESGIYKVIATYNGTSCELTSSIVIEIYPEIEVTKPNDLKLCVKEPIDLTQTNDEILAQIDDPENHTIEFFENLQDAENGTNMIANPTAYTPNTLPQLIIAKVINLTSLCHVTTSFNIILNESMTIPTINDMYTCEYDDVFTAVDFTPITQQINTASSIAGTVTYHLTLADAQNQTNAIASINAYTPTSVPQTIYISAYATETGCITTGSFTITTPDKPTFISLADVNICKGYSLIELPTGYYYSTDKYGNGSILNPGHLLGIGEHNIYINQKDSTTGCVFSIAQKIIVRDCEIQKGISPNEDGLNDYFDLTDYKPLSVSIFNRYGKEVYTHGTGYTNQWNGLDKSGNKLPDGTYFYNITVPSGILSGYIYLTREIK